MRWIFILVISLNLLLYFQQKQQGSYVTPEPEQPMEGSIRLLSELEGRGGVAEQGSSNSKATCGTLGGFDQEQAALALQQRLRELDIDARLEPVDAKAGTDHWVYLPPLVSRQAALSRLREMQARNIDSYIITVGELANGVSLGIFSRREAAEAHRQRLRELGYDSLIRDLPRTRRSYRLAFDVSAWSRVQGPIAEELADQFPVMQMQEKSCGGIASSEQVK